MLKRNKFPGLFVKGRSAKCLACFSLVLAFGLWPLGWWETPAPQPSPWTVETKWIEFVSTGRGAVLLAFDRSPTAADILDRFHLSTTIETSAEEIPTPARVVFHAQLGEVEIRPLSGAAALSLGLKMDLNRTSVRDLALLPGIGPAIARRIAAEQNNRGDFTSPEDLTRVRGVGPNTIEKIRPFVRIVRRESG